MSELANNLIKCSVCGEGHIYILVNNPGRAKCDNCGAEFVANRVKSTRGYRHG